jgi:hypothetical protein
MLRHEFIKHLAKFHLFKKFFKLYISRFPYLKHNYFSFILKFNNSNRVVCILLDLGCYNARAPFDKGRLVAQRRAPKVPAGDLPDPVPFDRVQGLDASL